MRRVAFAILSTIAGLVGLLSFKTESLGTTASSAAISTQPTDTATTPAAAPTAAAPSTTTSRTSAGTTTSTRNSSTTKARSTGSATSTSAATASKTVTGSVIQTQYGPVQVKITVRNRKVTAATVLQYPNGDPRSQQINAYAVPLLQKETVGVSSASSVDMVSGATYTSNGYLQSLQSALDNAGL